VIELGTTLQVVGNYSSKGKSLDITDTLTIDVEELTTAVNSPLLTPKFRRGLSERKLASTLTAGLRSQGWRTTTTTRGVSAKRNRTFPVKQHIVVPGVTENKLPLAKPTELHSLLRGAAGPRVLPITFTVLKGSVVLEAPRYTIAATDPSADAKTIPGKRESRTITLDRSTNQVAYDVRSEAFRNAALASVTSWTKWTPLTWVLGVLVALANDAVRERIKRLFKRGSSAAAKAD
jgi:hypothetical protein